jgi:tetratricopeptide (TPR) repeat protein
VPDRPNRFEFAMSTAMERARKSALQDRYEKAVREFRRIHYVRRKRQGSEHREALLAAAELGTALTAAGHPAEAVSLLEDTVRRLRSRFGEDDGQFIHAATMLRGAYVRAGIHADQFGPFRRTLVRTAMIRLGEGDLAEQQKWIAYHLAIAHRDAGDLSSALYTLIANDLLTGKEHPTHWPAAKIERAAMAAHRRLTDYAGGTGPPLTADDAGAVSFLNQCCRSSPDGVDLRRLCADVVEWYGTYAGPDSADALEARFALAQALAADGHTPEANAEYERVYERRKATLPEGHPDLLAAVAAIAGVYLGQGRHAEVVTVSKPVVDEWRHTFGDDDMDTLHLGVVLLQSLMALSRVDEGEPYLTWLEEQGYIEVER